MANVPTLDSTQLFDQVLSQRIPHTSHYSDLYLPVNCQTRALIRRYQFRSNVTAFQNQLDNKTWYDVPFAYSPFWDNKLSKR